TETNHAGLYVFDGNNANTNQISSGNPGTLPGGAAGAFWGFTPPAPFTSTSPDGCLTFRFVSDGSVTQQGWVASVTCGPADDLIRLVAFIDTNGDGIKQNSEIYCQAGQFTVEQ